MSTDSLRGKRGLRSLFASALRSRRSRRVLQKPDASVLDPPAKARQVRPGSEKTATKTTTETPQLSPLQAHREKYRALHAQVDTQLGERSDYTTMLHSIGMHDLETINMNGREVDNRPPGELQMASLTSELWLEIAGYLNPTDAASLAFATSTLYHRLGPRPWKALMLEENREYRNDFLSYLDRQFPHHLLCIPCAQYHIRTQRGHERLEPAGVINPLFNCPNMYNNLIPPPRHRITHGRTLPFTFVQLAVRARRFSPQYGIPFTSLERRWRRDGWAHSTRYHIHNGRLLMRVVSTRMAEPGLPPSAKRVLLYSQSDYWPYFSVCAHWRDGELMEACKCALDHIPKPRVTAGLQGIEHKVKDGFAGRNFDPNAIASLCSRCQPMRRCPQCPTEYLIEIKLTEDRTSPKSIYFHQAIIITRWSDLGDGSSPTRSREWAACNGLIDDYDSFKEIGRRAISSIFEASITPDTLPGQRVISMNPKGTKLGERGHNWY